MNIVVAVKVVPDDQDIQVAASGELDMSKAHQTISAYDVNAIEAAVQLAYKLGVPVTTAAVEIIPVDAGLCAKRRLEDVVETVELPMPCVVSVLPDIALPRIPGMKDILAAGKKPMRVEGAPAAPETTVEIVDIKAPKAEERKLEVKSASDDGAIEAFAAAIKSALQ